MAEDSKSAVDILKEYEHPEAEQAAPPAPTPEVKPRDPVTGQFLKQPVPSRLTSLARSLGISEDEINNSSAKDLRDAINDIRLERSFQARDEQRQPPPVAQPAPTSQPVEDDKFDGEEDIAPQIVNVLKSLRKSVRELRSENEQLKSYQKRQQDETVAQRLDRAFDDLGMESLFGKGSKFGLDPEGFESKQRDFILAEAIKLAGKNANLEAVAAKIKDAVQSRFGTSPKPVKKAKEADSIQKDLEQFFPQRFSKQEWDEAGIARPSHREVGDDEPRGTKRAEAAVAEWQSANGVNSANATTDDQFLP